jgi:transcription initiation factor IIE alpha subunit
MKSTRLPRLIKAITDIGMTTQEIAETLYCTPRSARMLVKRLRDDGLVHIQQWINNGHTPVAVYRYGIGVDAVKQEPVSSTDRVRKWRRKESLDDKAFRMARQRGRRVKIKRDPLTAAFYGNSNVSIK